MIKMEKIKLKEAVNLNPTEGTIFEGGKSFYVFADNKTECFKCGYCVLSGVDYLQGDDDTKTMPDFKKIKIGVNPSKLNPLLIDVPVAVNNAYGDAGLQWKNTVSKLEELNQTEHKGVVGIITKDWFRNSGIETLKSLRSDGLNIVILQSVSNLPQLIEPASFKLRINNLGKLVNAGIPVLPYLRPIIPNHNDSEELIESTIQMCAERGITGLVYSGLMGTPQVLDLLKKRTGKTIVPPKGYSQWMSGHKLVSEEKRAFVEYISRDYGIEPFRKTSCGVSFVTGLPADYNVHYARPDKYGCIECKMNEKCSEYASKQSENGKDKELIKKSLDIIKAEGIVEEKDGVGKCHLEDVCNNPCTACSISNGTKIHVKGTYTLGELGLVRWLTNLTIYSDEMIDTNRMFFMYDNIDRVVCDDN